MALKIEKRAKRRQATARAQSRATKTTKMLSIPGWETEEQILMRARKNRDHLATCSCQMCRNPRTSKITKGKDKLTLQERRAQKPNEL